MQSSWGHPISELTNSQQGDGQYVEERPGHITSDSLAAESLKNDGSFAANQSNVGYSSQPSRSTTANTHDTSGATRLPATSDSTSRLPDNYAQGQYQTASSTSNPAERSGDAYYSKGLDGGVTGSSDAGSGAYGSNNAGTAPGYAGNRGLSSEQAKPKGSVREGGDILGSEPNASFNSEIGTRNDPGRFAEQGFANANSRSAADAGYPGAQNAAGSTNQGGYENLDRDTSS